MALARRKEQVQLEPFVTSDRLPRSIGYVLCRKLNALIALGGFDRWVEYLREPFYAQGKSSPGVPHGVSFRKSLVGCSVGTQSQRGIAWRCAERPSLCAFLSVSLTKDTPDYSSRCDSHEILPLEMHDATFEWVLRVDTEKRLLNGKSVAVDTSTHVTNAATKSIGRRDSGGQWCECVAPLIQEVGVAPPVHKPTHEELRNFDRTQQDQKVSNDEWISVTYPESHIARRKDGTTHLSYEEELVVDIDSKVIMAADVYSGDQRSVLTLENTVNAALTNQVAARSDVMIDDVVADEGDHSVETLDTIAKGTPFRTCIPKPKRRYARGSKSPRRGDLSNRDRRKAILANYRRMRGAGGRRHKRLRNERAKRTFAQLFETGGIRSTWRCGLDKVGTIYSLAGTTYEFEVLMCAPLGRDSEEPTTFPDVPRRVFFTSAGCLYLRLNRPVDHLLATLTQSHRTTPTTCRLDDGRQRMKTRVLQRVANMPSANNGDAPVSWNYRVHLLCTCLPLDRDGAGSRGV